MLFSKVKQSMIAVSIIVLLGLVSPFTVNANTITSGDNFSPLALAMRTPVEELSELNEVRTKNLVFMGQLLDFNQEVNDIFVQMITDIQLQAAAKAAEAEAIAAAEAQYQAEIQDASSYTTENPVQQTQDQSQPPVQTAPVVTADAEYAAKEEIARRESGGSYTARNGQFYGRYQLMLDYLNGDLSPENQERVADAYVKNRYGSWTAALAFWNANGWY